MKELMNDVLDFLGYDLNLFSVNPNTQTTETSGLSDGMKTYYSDYIIDNAKPYLVHDQFGQERPIPQSKGKTIEFRKYSPLPKALTPLTEGVTPNGRDMELSVINATPLQYGDYITTSDILSLTFIDNAVVEATKLLGQQAGETLDTVVREVLNGGTNVQYAENAVAARYLLAGGDSNPANNHYMSVNAIRRAVRTMKQNKAKKINGSYVGIINPDVAFDLMGDDDWREPKAYVDTKDLYEGEIGKIHGVRFVETTEAKIFEADDLVTGANATRNLTTHSVSEKVITLKGTWTEAQIAALVGRKIIVARGTARFLYTVASGTRSASADSSTITTTETHGDTHVENDVIYPGEAGRDGRTVYSTLIVGDNAYGTTKLSGGGLEVIVKQLGSAGTSDPLNQRATVGWKATKTAIILVNEFMIRLETASTFESSAN